MMKIPNDDTFCGLKQMVTNFDHAGLYQLTNITKVPKVLVTTDKCTNFKTLGIYI